MTRKVRTSKGEAEIFHEGDLAAAERRQRAVDATYPDSRARAESTTGATRPRKIEGALLADICERIAAGTPRLHACSLSGVSRSAFYEAIEKREEVRDAVERAEALSAEVMRREAITALDPTTAKVRLWLLERLHPRLYAPAPQKVETSGPEGAPQKHEIVVTIEQATEGARGSSDGSEEA